MRYRVKSLSPKGEKDNGVLTWGSVWGGLLLLHFCFNAYPNYSPKTDGRRRRAINSISLHAEAKKVDIAVTFLRYPPPGDTNPMECDRISVSPLQ